MEAEGSTSILVLAHEGTGGPWKPFQSSPSWVGATVPTLGAPLEATGPDPQETTELEVHLGWRWRRNVERLLSHWRVCLMGRSPEGDLSLSRTSFPIPRHSERPDQQQEVTLETAETKALSGLKVRGLNRQRLEGWSPSPWGATLALGEGFRLLQTPSPRR